MEYRCARQVASVGRVKSAVMMTMTEGVSFRDFGSILSRFLMYKLADKYSVLMLGFVRGSLSV